MSSLTILGDTSGSVVLAAPAVAGSTTLTLPATSGTVLTTGSTGCILQVVQGTTTGNTTSTSSTYVTTGLTASITPKSATNKILVMYSAVIASAAADDTYTTIFKNGSNLLGANGAGHSWINYSTSLQTTVSSQYLDSPATTASTTYTIYFKNYNNSSLAQFGCSYLASITLMEVAA
jgi:hypothetical protein